MINKLLVISLFLLVFGASASTPSPTLYVQLQWYFQASATTVWLPLAIGYYDAENLTVVVNQGGPNVNAEYYVQQKVADIGFGWLQVALSSYNTGNPADEMVVVAQIDQRSSQRLVTLKSSGINSLHDLRDKTVCLWSVTGLTPDAALQMRGIPFKYATLGSTPYPLLTGTCDAVQVLTYNELGLLLQMTNPATGNLVQESELNIFDLGDEVYTMEDVIFVRKEWVAVPKNKQILMKFLKVVAKTAMFARDNPTETIKYYNPSSNVDQWQLYITNQIAWPNASLANIYGLVNETQVNRTMTTLTNYGAFYGGFVNPNITAADVFDNSYMELAVAELKLEGYRFNIDVPTIPLTWCLDVGATNPHVCRGNEKHQVVTDYAKSIRIFNIASNSVLLVLSLGVLLAVLAYNDRRIIQIASPNYLYLMLTGAFMMYTGAIVYNTGVTVASCNVYIWCVSLGFTLMYMPYICKTWRIYRIFDETSVARKAEPWQPYALLMCSAVIVNLIILILFSTLKQITTSPVVSPFDIYTLYNTCHWNKALGYVLIGYAGLLILTSVWLAALVYKVDFTLVNESKSMLGAIFATLFLAIMVLLVVFYQSNPNTSVLLQSIGICVICITNTGLMFAKKIYQCIVYGDIEPKRKAYSGSGSNPTSTKTRSDTRSR